jgi:hypothetical protein
MSYVAKNRWYSTSYAFVLSLLRCAFKGGEGADTSATLGRSIAYVTHTASRRRYHTLAMHSGLVGLAVARKLAMYALYYEYSAAGSV